MKHQCPACKRKVGRRKNGTFQRHYDSSFRWCRMTGKYAHEFLEVSGICGGPVLGSEETRCGRASGHEGPCDTAE